MPLLPSLPENATLLHVFRKFPNVSTPLIQYHEALLRGPSPLSVAERELIAAFVSGVNEIAYCVGVHGATARVFGIDEGVFAQLLDDIDASEVDDKLKPILHFVRKLTEAPGSMLQADADKVFAAGWDEAALHDAISVCSLFNFMNRLVAGTGVTADEDYYLSAAQRLKGGYLGLIDMMK